jgi:hypothetical protein
MSAPYPPRRQTVSVIPEDLRLFEPNDIKKVFDYLEKEFHLNKVWYQAYKAELVKVQHGVPEQEFFFRYCCEHFDPPLQKLLRRRESVIFALSRYLIRDRIREKKKENENLKNYYKNGEWKNGKR